MPARGFYTDPKVVDRIGELFDLGYPAIRIYELVGAELQDSGVSSPGQRTVERICADLRLRDNRPWSVRDAVPDHLRAVLDVQLAVADGTQGRKTNLSATEAKFVGLISQAGPTLSPWHIWRLARLYVSRAEDRDTLDLDHFLAISPEVVPDKVCQEHRRQGRSWCFDLVLGQSRSSHHEAHVRRWPDRIWPPLGMGACGMPAILTRDQFLARTAGAPEVVLLHSRMDYVPGEVWPESGIINPGRSPIA